MKQANCLIVTMDEVAQACAEVVTADYLKNPESLCNDIVNESVPAFRFRCLDDCVGEIQSLYESKRLPKEWQVVPVLLVTDGRLLAVAIYLEEVCLAHYGNN